MLALALLASPRLDAGVVEAASRGGPGRVVVTELAGVEREGWPLTFGMPFGRSQLRAVERIRVVDAAGAALPRQVRVLGRWDDGSIRWVLLDTQVKVAARGNVTLHVSTGQDGAKLPPAQPAGGLRVTEDGESVSVATGRLGFRVAKAHFGPVESLEAGAARVRGPLQSFLEIEGKRLSAGAPRRVRVLESGPLRVRIDVEGEYGEGIGYLTRVEAYAGQPFVRIQHSFVDRNPKPYVTLRAAAVELPLPTTGSARYRIGIEGQKEWRGVLGDASVRAHQVDNATLEEKGTRRKGKLAGWVQWSGEKATMGLAGRWFWQEYPKSLVLQPGRLTYYLWPPESGPTRVGMGAAKTHEFFVWITSGDEDVEPDSLPASTLVAAVDPAWVANTGALPNMVTPTGEAGSFLAQLRDALGRYRQRQDTERWDDRGSVDCPDGSGSRPRQGAYGMWNWGDWNFPGYQDNTKGCDAWGNLEYDTTQVLALLFASTGDATASEELDAAARHFMDVDTVHFHDRHPEWVGMNHPKNPLHFSFELGGVDLGHTWTEGLVTYYWLTGDDRALTAARGIADYLVGRVRSVQRGNPRQWGWPAIALLAVYEATGEEKYLSAASEYARRGMHAHPARSVGHWKAGVLGDALCGVHARKRDPEIERWLLEFASRVVRLEKQDLRFYPAVACAASLRGDASLRRAAVERVRKIDLGNWGKPFTIGGRLGFRIHSLLQAGEVTSAPSVVAPTRSGEQ